MPQLREMNSLCIRRAMELSTGQTSAHLNLPSRAGGTGGKGGGQGQGIYSSTTQGDEHGDQRESLPTLPGCGSLPKSMKWALLPACFLLEKVNWQGSQLALSPSLWLGWALSQGRFVQVLPPCPPTQWEAPLMEGKGCSESALERLIKLSMATQMRLGKADQNDTQWSWVLFRLRLFYIACMEKEILM